MTIGSRSKLTTALGCVLMLSMMQTAGAADNLERVGAVAVANGFYAAINSGAQSQANRPVATKTVANLLAEGGQIELTDLGVTQTNDDFTDSLDNVFDALEGGFLAHRVEPNDAGSDGNISVLVCYGFPSNAVMNQEILQVANGQITTIVQTKIADDCYNF